MQLDIILSCGWLTDSFEVPFALLILGLALCK